MKLYTVDKNYINYLRKFDNKVMNPEGIHYKKEKLYLGILFKKDESFYFAPLSSSKEKDYTFEKKPKKDSLTIVYLIDSKDKNKILGKISLNNMIPIQDLSLIKLYNIEFEKDLNYKSLLLKEYSELLKKEKSILKKSILIYKIKYNDQNRTIASHCVDFKLLEEKALEWEKQKTIERKEGSKNFLLEKIEAQRDVEKKKHNL